MRKYFDEGRFHIPNATPVETDGPALPYVLLADEAFPLTSYMMRPYLRISNLDLKKKVFNYRLSRARRVVESAFGILAARWRIYRKLIIASIATAKSIVQATVTLHNFIIIQEEKMYSRSIYARLSPEDDNIQSEGLNAFSICTEQLHNGIEIRNVFSDFFMNAGATSSQWKKALNNNF